jgi:hypothetical protein
MDAGTLHCLVDKGIKDKKVLRTRSLGNVRHSLWRKAHVIKKERPE